MRQKSKKIYMPLFCNLFYSLTMPRRGCSKFHLLSDRSKRRRVNEDEGCSNWPSSSDDNFSSRLSCTKKSFNTSQNNTDPDNGSNTLYS